MKKNTVPILLCIYLFLYPFCSYFLTRSAVTIVHHRYRKSDRVVNIVTSGIPGVNIAKNIVDVLVIISATQGAEEASW